MFARLSADTDLRRAYGTASSAHAAELQTAAARLTALSAPASMFGPVGARFLAALTRAVESEARAVTNLRDSLAATAVHGTVCFSGMLSDSWTISDFYPMDWIPNGVRLTAYSGQAQDLPAEVLQRILDRIESGDLDLLPVHSYPLADIAQAHEDMALGRRVGKLVGLPWA